MIHLSAFFEMIENSKLANIDTEEKLGEGEPKSRAEKFNLTQ
jgi:hypothetical protein